MGDIIQFPGAETGENKSKDEITNSRIIQSILMMCRDSGLTVEQAEDVLRSYMPIYKFAFEEFELKVRLPDDKSFSDKQLSMIEHEYNALVEQIMEDQTNRMIVILKELLKSVIDSYRVD